MFEANLVKSSSSVFTREQSRPLSENLEKGRTKGKNTTIKRGSSPTGAGRSAGAHRPH